MVANHHEYEHAARAEIANAIMQTMVKTGNQ